MKTAIQARGAALRENGSKIDALGKEMGSLTTEIRENGSEIHALTTEIRENRVKRDARFEALITEFKSIRREIRIILALLGLLFAIVRFGWLG